MDIASLRHSVLGHAAAIGVVAAATAGGWIAVGHASQADVVMIYLLGVVIVAMRFGYAPSLLASLLSVAAFDFFFTLPYFSFAVLEPRLLITFAIMTFVALAIAERTERLRRQSREGAEHAMRAERARVDVETERLRNALLSSVSHDFRTPLAIIQGAATSLLEKDEAPDRCELAQTISDEASRLNRIIRNVLAMTSLEAGAMQVKRDWHSIEEVVGTALARLEERLREHRVVTHIPYGERLVAIDALLIEQVLINLIENAAKYSAPQETITISAQFVTNGFEVEVSDSGQGIPHGEEERIFEKFHRASKTQPGMGLGLTICRGIVTAHGGRIACHTREGGGASFRFFLPSDAPPPLLDNL